MWKIREYDEVTSTNLLAKEQWTEGVIHHGDVLQAWHQTAGRGRIADRTWHDEPGHSLLMSALIERVPVSAHLMQYRAAISLITALRKFATDVASAKFILKWPNDILLNGRKVSGILSEGIWQGGELRAMIVGIGVNVEQESFNGLLSSSAISLKQVGISASVNEVRDVILDRLGCDIHSPADTQEFVTADARLIEQVRNELAWMSMLEPFDVVIGDGSVLHHMRYIEVTENGSLLLQDKDGMRMTLNAGSLEWTEHLSGIAAVV